MLSIWNKGEDIKCYLNVLTKRKKKYNFYMVRLLCPQYVNVPLREGNVDLLLSACSGDRPSY